MDLNPTQLKILTQLNTTIDCKRYSELKLDGIENDLFNYHLQYLVSVGLVKKNTLGYEITKDGKSFMADLDAQGKKYELFRLSVIINAIKIENGIKYVLAQRRKRHPYFNDVSTISGKIKKGEFAIDAAIRKLREETGLIANNLQNIGTLRKIRTNHDQETIEDTFYTVFYTENPTGKLITSNEFGENMWLPFNDFLKLQQKNVDLGEFDIEIMKRIREKNLDMFYFEQKSEITAY